MITDSSTVKRDTMEQNPKQENKLSFAVRGGVAVGTVVSAKTKQTAIIERDSTKFLSKYKRYAKVKSRLAVHVPTGMTVKVGDLVKVGETRRISKTKSWVVLEIVAQGE